VNDGPCKQGIRSPAGGAAFTGGIYLPIWFLTRLAQFNGLQSEEKLGKGELVGSLVALVAAVLLGLFAGLAAFFNPAILAEGGSLATYADLIANIVTLLAIIALVQQTFRAKRILLDHYRGYLQQDVAFSPLLTLLFLNIYLQYKINRLSSWQPVGR